MIYMAFPGSVPWPGISPPQTPQRGEPRADPRSGLIPAFSTARTLLPALEGCREPGWLWCGRWLQCRGLGTQVSQSLLEEGASCPPTSSCCLALWRVLGPRVDVPTDLTSFLPAGPELPELRNCSARGQSFLLVLCPLVAACTLWESWVRIQSCPRPGLRDLSLGSRS